METNEGKATLVDPACFTLASCDRVRIEMPPMPEVTDDDIEAQLFSYVANAPKGSKITSIADLDDAWVQASLPLYGGIGELRDAIRTTLVKETEIAFDEIKFAKCADVLVGRLEGDVPAEAVAAQAEAVRVRNEEALRLQGTTLRRYLEDSRMSIEEYEAKLREEAERELSLNVALDKMIEATEVSVAVDELTEYLTCEDPDEFLAELRESGRVDEARQAAARVKVMRRIIETADVETVEA